MGAGRRRPHSYRRDVVDRGPEPAVRPPWSIALITPDNVAKSALDKAREAPGSTKARILVAAEEVFAAKGFQGASTREIAARAGVNISSLHYHWASKETLYFAVFRNIYDQIVALLRDSLAPLVARPGNPRVTVERTMGALFDFFADNPN